jgi:hypothetical protein
MDRRAIDLSDEEEMSTLSSSAYDIPNDAPSASNVENSFNDSNEVLPVRVDMIGYENVHDNNLGRSFNNLDGDAYSGYVCVRTFGTNESSGEESDEELLSLAGTAERLAIGSGSMLSAGSVSERSRVQLQFSQAFADVRIFFISVLF